MFPTLFKLGPVEIHTYGVFVALGFFIGFKVLLYYGKKINISASLIESLTFLVFIFSIIGARIFYVLISWGEFRDNFLDVFKVWQGGLVFWGGFLGGALTVIIFALKNKISIWKMGDAFAPALAIGHALGRIGCFFAGCCYGKPNDSFFGVLFPKESLAPCDVKRLPTQLISAVLLLILFFILKYFWNKKRFDGQVMLVYVILYSLGRFFIEFFRGDFRGYMILGITPTQIVAIIVFVISFVFYYKKVSKMSS